MSDSPKLYSAEWLLPVVGGDEGSSAVVRDGALLVSADGRVADVGERHALRAAHPQIEARHYPRAAIIPGLVNCHTHLELTALRGYLEREETNFFGWLRKLTAARVEVMTDDDVLVSATWGACEALRAGVTCVGDASDQAPASVHALRATNLRGIVFQEAFGPDPALARAQFDALRDKMAALRPQATDQARVGVSPHAPYTVSGPLLQLMTRYALDENLPLMTHAAESQAEEMFVRQGGGVFYEGLTRRGIAWTAPRKSSVQYLESLGVLDARPLLAHCVTVDEADIETIKMRGARVAHCPKSNAKLRHGAAPFARFVERGVTTGLGSDSVASNNTNDLLEEARFAVLLARARGAANNAAASAVGVAAGMSAPQPGGEEVGAADALRAATRGGAEALGLEDEIGSLRVGRRADFAVVTMDGAHQLPVYGLVDALVFCSSARDVALTVVGGREAYRDGRVTGVDEERLRARVAEIGAKLAKIE